MAGGADLAGGLTNLGFGIQGRLQAASDKMNADSIKNAVMLQWLQANVPNPADQAVAYKQFVQTGQLSPQLAKAFEQSQSEMENISPNAEGRSAQINALKSLENEGLAGGLSLEDRATLQEQMNDVNAGARGRNDAILQSFAAKGMGGSGMQLQAQLQNAQNATQNAGNNSLRAAADARKRALASIQGAGELGGRLEANDFSEKSQIAKAKDAINQFNARNRQQVENLNTGRINDANKYNLDLQQDISNRNTNLSNQEQQYNKKLLQDQYDNRIKQMNGYQNAAYGYAGALNDRANDTANMWQGIGSGAGKLISGYGASNNKPKRDTSNYTNNDYQMFGDPNEEEDEDY